MNKYILIFLVLFFVFFPSYAQTVKVESPVYLGVMLVDKSDIKDMSETCRYYEFAEAPTEEDFTVYESTDGTKIRFKILDKTPVIEVVTKEKNGNISKALKNLDFKKEGKTYVRESNMYGRNTICTVTSSPTTLHITKSAGKIQ